MAQKKRSNKVLNEIIDAMETKYTAIENLNQKLVSTSKKEDKARGLCVCRNQRERL